MYWLQEQIETSHINTPDWTTKKDISFVYSNSRPSHRNDYFNVLSKHFQINSGGKHLNNIGYIVKDKIKFMSQHAYDLSIENCFEFGYSTEKLFEPILAQTIPIYWGHIPKMINPLRYIQAPPDPIDLIRYIKHLNKTPQIAQDMLQQPALIHKDVLKNEYLRLKNHLHTIIEKHITKTIN
jgi:hypothetical protein